ncbi:MAG TPA: peroxiredoxin family protein [Streptosporangiaceae bacterium]|nr:peroxiredoxin family protein [Streptosporangiaceae bacterium]
MTTTGDRRSGRASKRHPHSAARRATHSRPGQSGGSGQPGGNRPNIARLKADRRRQARRRARRHGIALWSAVVVALAGIVTAAMLTTRAGSTQTGAARRAPAFTLQDTSGKAVSLAGYHGRNVVLYFNEGVGCDACFYQMAEFEKHAGDLAKAGVTIVPIVMNPASEVRRQLAGFNLRTPYLIDATGSVSRDYNALGKGMHAGMPGHGFVLIDGTGTQRWYGEYPSMYLSTADLLRHVKEHLPT